MFGPRLGLAVLLAAGLAHAQAFSPASPDEQVFSPMRGELDRSLRRLKLGEFKPPYFLLYRLVDTRRLAVSASWGSLTGSKRDEGRVLYVEARAGDRTLDNTWLRTRGQGVWAPSDPEALRQRLWQETDEAYKNAVAGYLEKKARKATELDVDKLDDFSQEPSAAASAASPPPDGDLQAVSDYVRRLSAAFNAYPFVYDSQATLDVHWARRYLLTSEGTRLATPFQNAPVRLGIDAWTRADDGMALGASRHWVARSAAELPLIAEAEREARLLAERLEEDRRAPLQEPFSAPAILDAEFTGVLFHEAVGHKLEGQRQRDPDQASMFKDRIGERILPEFLSLIDDPALAEFKGTPLHGHYDFDDEGVPARKVVLVDRGVLKSFLMSRWPVKGFARSNGHGRADLFNRPTGRMANLMVIAHRTVSGAELKKRLMELCRRQGKAFGFKLVGAVSGENPSTRESAQTLEVRPQRVLRVDARTGEETPVRGVKLVGTPMALVNRIVTAADDATLSNHYFCGAESGMVPVDQIAPSVLVSDVELQRVPEARARPPILPSPFHDKSP